MNQANASRNNVVIGLGQLKASDSADAVLVCLGLGSCVALCAFDSVNKVAGMAHMVLPLSSEAHSQQRGPRFVDCAIPTLIEEMERLGASRHRLAIKIAGGAQMIASASANGLFNIGERNVQVTERVLRELRLPLLAADTGGSHGRSVRLDVGTGRVLVSSVGGDACEL